MVNKLHLPHTYRLHPANETWFAKKNSHPTSIMLLNRLKTLTFSTLPTQCDVMWLVKNTHTHKHKEGVIPMLVNPPLDLLSSGGWDKEGVETSWLTANPDLWLTQAAVWVGPWYIDSIPHRLGSKWCLHPKMAVTPWGIFWVLNSGRKRRHILHLLYSQWSEQITKAALFYFSGELILSPVKVCLLQWLHVILCVCV